ncbi:MAG TPA: hypothetical protein VKT49_04580 [Bryobacteraceae bacterium]|nr:hypothetical protein [Bryobacteraceae bacterium]
MGRTSWLVAVVLAGTVAGLGQAPVIDATRKVENGASFVQGQAVAPGSLVTIFGNNFVSAFAQFDTVPLSTSLGGMSVTVNNIPAPVVNVVPKSFNPALVSDQASIQLPWGVLPAGAATGSATVVVTTAAGASAPVTIPLSSISPGLFQIFTDSTGVARPAAYNNSDISLPLPPGIQVPGYTSRPSKPGEVLVLWATGLGPVNNQPPDGQPGLGQAPFSATMTTPTVLVGGVQANVVFAVLSPQYPSMYQIAITIPANAPVGNAVSLQIQMNGITTTDQNKIAISQ